MRASEFITEAKLVDYEGITLKVTKNDYELMVDALDDWGNNVLGHVTFYMGDDKELDPQDLWVNEKYQGQGIAKVMYDYIKKLGYKIVRSYDQTDAGAGFWNKHRGEEVRVWEETNSNVVSNIEVWNYVGDIHPKDQQGGGFLKRLIMRHPQYQLKRVPLSSLHIPDQEYDDAEQEPDTYDPYGRGRFVDFRHAGEYSMHHIDKRPIVIDTRGYILDGTHRAWAAAELMNKKDILAYVPIPQLKEQGILEAFNQPYNVHWEKTNGDWHATSDLDDGSELVVLFMAQGDNSWMVEFERDENMEITGEGDAPRVFATVLTAMQQFIAKRKPVMLNFSAEKDDDPTGSRARLYDRMLQRYITGTGYDLTRKDYPSAAIYTLTRIKPQKQLTELGDSPSEYKPNNKRKRSLFHSTVDNHWVDVFFDRSEFNDTLHITFTVNGDYDAPEMPTSASKSTIKILSTVLNIVKKQLPEYMAKARPPAISFTAKGDNRASLYRKYFVPVIQNILGPKWQHEEYPNMGMIIFHWKPIKK